jgi:hydroxymethylpyrimidine/phosphomethylpyrimidine kinase
MHTIPVVLTIAGSDNSAGAGIQADLKTMGALGVYGVTAITCVVAEVPGKVSAIHPVDPGVVVEQIRLIFEAFPVAAVKTGMLHSLEIINIVADMLERTAGAPRPPLVVDPVMVATSGARLLKTDALTGYRTRLFRSAALVTPNLDEVGVLWGRPVHLREEMVEAGHALVAEYGTAFLVKGGHLKGNVAADVLVSPDGSEEWFEAPFVRGVATHGTGCTYSAAIAAGLGRGLPMSVAVGQAKRYLSRVVAGYLRWERSGVNTDALHHFAQGSDPDQA